MGNLQTNEPKHSAKSGKSQNKVKSLMKIRGKKGNKIDSSHFTALVQDEEETEQSCLSDEKPLEEKKDLIVTDSWCKVNRINEDSTKGRTPPSSSDSNFTDPLTPVGCNTEMNQCYYSEESVELDVDVSSTQEEFLENLTLNSFKLNEYRARHEEVKTKKLSKLGLSKTSQISLDSDPKESFSSDNVEIVNNTQDEPYDSGTLKRKSLEEEEDTKKIPNGIIFKLYTVVIINNVNILGHHEYKRHLSEPAKPPDGLVLRKVASFSLNKTELDLKITKPKFVPEKLDFQLYEKFEGKRR